MDEKPQSTYGSPIVQLSNVISSRTTWESSLEGKLLTFVDATFSDQEQRKAVKSLIKGIVRDHYQDINGDVLNILNIFTDVFEGTKIEYTFFDNPNGQYDHRNNEITSPYIENMFHNE